MFNYVALIAILIDISMSTYQHFMSACKIRSTNMYCHVNFWSVESKMPPL